MRAVFTSTDFSKADINDKLLDASEILSVNFTLLPVVVPLRTSQPHTTFSLKSHVF